MKFHQTIAASVVALCAFGVSAANAANLMVNGDFELGSLSSTVTPTGWTNIGHSDGVIAYSEFGTPAYSGSYFYDLGGFGDAAGPVGDGIMQTVATTAGTLYQLTFGLTSEDVSGLSTLEVLIGGSPTFYNLTSTGGPELAKGFTTETLSYLATGSSTAISFIETANTSGGNNDPMIDNVIFQTGGAAGVPEPATWAMFLLGFGAIGWTLRSRRDHSAMSTTA